MRWSAITFDWNRARAFLATAEEGSLSRAARALGTTQPTLGRQVAALERELGVALFERAGRGLVLTASGRAVLEEVRAMGAAAMRVSLVAAGRSEDVAGTVSVSVSDVMAGLVMPDLLVELRARAPEVMVDLVVTNSLSDLRRRDADIAIRHVPPEEPELIARHLKGGQVGLWATPEFLDIHGRPARIADLAGMPFVGMAPAAEMLRYLQGWGLPVTLADLSVQTDSMAAAWEMARRGLGIGVTTDDIARRSGGMERILPEFSPMRVDVWLTTHREVRTSRRIRLVFDFLVEALGRRWGGEGASGAGGVPGARG